MMQKCALEIVLSVVTDSMPFYEPAIVNSELVHSESYERPMKRVNYCVSLCDGSML